MRFYALVEWAMPDRLVAVSRDETDIIACWAYLATQDRPAQIVAVDVAVEVGS